MITLNETGSNLICTMMNLRHLTFRQIFDNEECMHMMNMHCRMIHDTLKRPNGIND